MYDLNRLLHGTVLLCFEHGLHDAFVFAFIASLHFDWHLLDLEHQLGR